MKEICEGCLVPKYIVNKKYTMCEECNHFRIHGESIQDTRQKQHQKWIEKAKDKAAKQPPKPQKIYTIKQSTSKTAKKNKEVLDVKMSISEKALMDGEYFCKGCGGTQYGLDRSHILSEKQRPDLAAEEENIDLLCRVCHMRWESWDILKMALLFCFEKYLKYIYRLDQETFFKIFNKMEDHLEKKFDENNEISVKIKTLVKQYYKKFT